MKYTKPDKNNTLRLNKTDLLVGAKFHINYHADKHTL